MGEGVLLGRDAEERQMRQLLTHARNGRGGSLLLSGDPGIGKTTLLEAVTSEPPGVRVPRISGFEAERQVPFAAV